jgi:hypothetical protein
VVPAEDDATPFPREDTVMTIYDRRPSLVRRRVPDPSLRTQLTTAGDAGTQKCKCMNFLVHKHMYIYHGAIHHLG